MSYGFRCEASTVGFVVLGGGPQPTISTRGTSPTQHGRFGEASDMARGLGLMAASPRETVETSVVRLVTHWRGWGAPGLACSHVRFCLAHCVSHLFVPPLVCSDDACNKKQPNQTGDGINFASTIKGHELVFQHVVLLCWLSVCHVDCWRIFICTLPPPPSDFNVVASSVHPLAKFILRKG